MSELDYVTVSGFKSIARIEKLETGRLTVLVGPNGSGKTNFIGVFSFLNAIREGGLRSYVARAGGADRVLHFGSRVTGRLHMLISFKNEMNQYEINLEPNGADELVPSSEFVWFRNRSEHGRSRSDAIGPAGREAGISRRRRHGPVAGYVRERLDGWRLYHFHDTGAASPLKKTADVHDNRRLRPDGANLAPFLHFCARSTKTPTASSWTRFGRWRRSSGTSPSNRCA